MTEIIKDDAYQNYCDTEKENAKHLTDGFVSMDVLIKKSSSRQIRLEKWKMKYRSENTMYAFKFFRWKLAFIKC